MLCSFCAQWRQQHAGEPFLGCAVRCHQQTTARVAANPHQRLIEPSQAAHRKDATLAGPQRCCGAPNNTKQHHPQRSPPGPGLTLIVSLQRPTCRAAGWPATAQHTQRSHTQQHSQQGTSQRAPAPEHTERERQCASRPQVPNTVLHPSMCLDRQAIAGWTGVTRRCVNSSKSVGCRRQGRQVSVPGQDLCCCAS